MLVFYSYWSISNWIMQNAYRINYLNVSKNVYIYVSMFEFSGPSKWVRIFSLIKTFAIKVSILTQSFYRIIIISASQHDIYKLASYESLSIKCLTEKIMEHPETLTDPK